MFAGIISHIGKVKKREGSQFVFETDSAFCKKLENGTSVAVNGVCLTVDHTPTKTTFAITIMPETERRTMLCELKENDEVNLELPLTPDTFVSGHFVQGHVDGTGRIIAIKDEGNSRIITVGISEKLSKYIVEKGSIAINGISLTVIKEVTSYFTVGIIPYTWENTMLHNAKYGDLVNIELDVLVKYVDKLLHNHRVQDKQSK